MRVKVFLARNRGFEIVEARFNKSKVFKLSKCSRSTSKKGSEVGLNSTSSYIPKRTRSRRIRRSREMTKRYFQCFDAATERCQSDIAFLPLLFLKTFLFTLLLSLFLLMVSNRVEKVSSNGMEKWVSWRWRGVVAKRTATTAAAAAGGFNGVSGLTLMVNVVVRRHFWSEVLWAETAELICCSKDWDCWGFLVTEC